ncbi:hypothetical protein ETAA8_37910 [Anatilimnocola aggregata]|uniref:Uncharacterized protein n=1 Tax=Anatilimnocola aggregata TaxID=2528021 RepID=A0A517YEQ2_9BACT|nr:hypothetical protein [Anatilimnocola aggregata]QDU28688.1 hypothetical protein ETAA8_37910 [Anatilimnocola aggregata]
MPIQLTNFPTKPFDEQFAQSSAEVRAYFREAWDIRDRVARFIEENTPPGKLKGRGKTRSGRPSMTKVIIEVMNETGSKKASVYDARQCGNTFSEMDVEEILQLCEDAALLPSRQLFLELMRVPAERRSTFASEVIGDRCSKEEIKLRRHEEFEKKGTTSKTPQAPRSQFELAAQVAKYRARLNFLFGLMSPPSVGGERQLSKLGFAIPSDLDSDIRTVTRGMKSLEAKCLHAVKESSGETKDTSADN